MSDLTPITSTALAAAVARYKQDEEERYTESMKWLHERYDGKMMKRRWFGLRSPLYDKTPTDDELIEWGGYHHPYSFWCIERWSDAQLNVDRYEKMVEIAQGQTIFLCKKSVMELFFD